MSFKKIKRSQLFVDIDRQKEEKEDFIKVGGILVPKESEKGVVQYRLATVRYVGQDIQEEYSEGDRIMILPICGEMAINYNGENLTVINDGSVIAVV